MGIEAAFWHVVRKLRVLIESFLEKWQLNPIFLEKLAILLGSRPFLIKP